MTCNWHHESLRQKQGLHFFFLIYQKDTHYNLKAHTLSHVVFTISVDTDKNQAFLAL